MTGERRPPPNARRVPVQDGRVQVRALRRDPPADTSWREELGRVALLALVRLPAGLIPFFVAFGLTLWTQPTGSLLYASFGVWIVLLAFGLRYAAIDRLPKGGQGRPACAGCTGAAFGLPAVVAVLLSSALGYWTIEPSVEQFPLAILFTLVGLGILGIGLHHRYHQHGKPTAARPWVTGLIGFFLMVAAGTSFLLAALLLF